MKKKYIVYIYEFNNFNMCSHGIILSNTSQIGSDDVDAFEFETVNEALEFALKNPARFERTGRNLYSGSYTQIEKCIIDNEGNPLHSDIMYSDDVAVEWDGCREIFVPRGETLIDIIDDELTDEMRTFTEQEKISTQDIVDWIDENGDLDGYRDGLEEYFKVEPWKE